MTKETMEKLQFPSLRPTPTIRELADRSTVNPKGMIEDVVVSIVMGIPISLYGLATKGQNRRIPIDLGKTLIGHC
jgi:hypothetical protein